MGSVTLNERFSRTRPRRLRAMTEQKSVKGRNILNNGVVVTSRDRGNFRPILERTSELAAQRGENSNESEEFNPPDLSATYVTEGSTSGQLQRSPEMDIPEGTTERYLSSSLATKGFNVIKGLKRNYCSTPRDGKQYQFWYFNHFTGL